MSPLFSPDITVKELLDRYPELLQLLDLGLLCVGCPAEAFHTLTDIVREYHLDLNQMLQRIYNIIRDAEASQGLSTPKKPWAEQP